MRAMILAAGKGTRMHPITHKIPKPLISVMGKPLIRYTLDALKKNGIREVIINLHHLSPELKKYLRKQRDMKIHFSVEKKLLGTGGGLVKAKPFFKGQRFLVINSDVIMSFNLKKVLRSHKANNALSTITVRPIPRGTTYEAIGINRQNKITKFKSKKIRPPLRKMFFTGVHILEPEIFDTFPKRKKIFCINADVYAPLTQKGYPLYGYVTPWSWEDLGTLTHYLKYHRKRMNKKKWNQFKKTLLKLYPGITFPKILG